MIDLIWLRPVSKTLKNMAFAGHCVIISIRKGVKNVQYTVQIKKKLNGNGKPPRDALDALLTSKRKKNGC